MQVASSQPELVGRALGDFVVREQIGEGGFGTVFRAEQPLLGREAVIKVMRGRSGAGDDVNTQRFLREARLASRLDHPYAAHIYAFGVEADGLHWIAMELVRGTPLSSLLRQRGRLPLDEVVPLIERLCEVVQTAHELGIVHRDLKPSNVMVIARAGRLLPKLLDFGIAKMLPAGAPPPAAPVPVVAADPTPVDDPDDTIAVAGDTSRAEPPPVTPITPTERSPGAPAAAGPDGWGPLTRADAVIGTPQYMAPEQWTDPAAAGARTDLYALGVITYEALCGRRLFEGRSLAELAHLHCHAPPPPLGPPFPRALDRVLDRALAKSAAERYASALELAAALRAAADLSPQPARLPRLDEALRDAWITRGPQPLAETIAALDAAVGAHQARAAAADVVRVAVGYVAVLALAARSRMTGVADDEPTIDALRELRRHGVGDERRLELARRLARPSGERPELHPVPDLVRVLSPPADELARALERVVAPAQRAAASEEEARADHAGVLAELALLLHALRFLLEYRLCVARGDRLEHWMGVRRSRRSSSPRPRVELADGEVVLVDADERPVLRLSPLAQVARPAPGQDEEIFWLAGPGAQAARLVAWPAGFERQDDDLWSWFGEHLLATSDSFADAGKGAVDDSNPYRGLAAFTAADAGLFFGRERDVEAAVNRLRVQSLVAVVGPSGAGKSSFVQAGVVPALPPGWRAVTLRPGHAPVEALLARLDPEATRPVDVAAAAERIRAGAAARAETLVVVVDQLEELFTLCTDAGEQALAAALLVALARSAEEPVRVVVTLRDDFLARAQGLAAFRDRLGPSLLLLGTPDRDDLIRIVTEPARRRGYRFEDEVLPARMAEAVSERAGALPLLSFSAAMLWQLRDRHFHQLPTRAYDALGGVGGALAQHAEEMLSHLLPDEQRGVRSAFRHLVTADGTRAVLTRGELATVLGGGAKADTIIEKLVAARLLVASEGEAGQERVEVVHEALLSAWPRLRTWRLEDAEGARLRDQLRAAAHQWSDRGRPRGLLWRDEALVEYQVWRSRQSDPLGELEAAFAADSLAEAARGRRTRRGAIALALGGLSIAVLVLTQMNAATRRQRSLAQTMAAKAAASAEAARHGLLEQYEELGRQALIDERPMPALVYLVEAYSQGDPWRPGLGLLIARAAAPVESQLHVLRGHQHRVVALDVSPDDARIVTASEDGTARLWDGGSGQPLATLAGAGSRVWDARFDPAGDLLVTASGDGAVRLYSASGQLVRELRAEGGNPEHRRDAVFSPDGRLVAVGGAAATVWEVASGRLRYRIGFGERARTFAFSPDGRLLAVAGDQGVSLHDAASGRRLRTLAADYTESVQFSPDGRLLATASWDKLGRLWDAQSGRLLAKLAGHTEWLDRVAFAPSGHVVATASRDGTARLWSVPGGELLHVLAGHTGAVNSVAFDRAGTLVATASADGSAAIWSVETGARLADLHGHEAAVTVARFTADGRVVTASFDRTARIWRPRSDIRAVLRGHADFVTVARFDPSGRRIVTASDDGTARLWDAATAGATAVLAGPPGPVQQARFSPDGGRVVTAHADGSVCVWDAATGARLRTWSAHQGGANDATFSPDGDRVLSAGADGVARQWDPAGARELPALVGHGSPILAATYDATGARVATASEDQTARIWDAASGQPIAVLEGHRFNVRAVAFSPDGRWVATRSFDSTARLWDAASGRLVHTLSGHTGIVSSAVFDAGSRRLITSSDDGSVKIWDVATGALSSSLDGTNAVLAVGVSPDGALLATAGGAGTVRLWELATGRLLAALRGHSDLVWSVEFSPDGRTLLAAGGDRLAVTWEIAYDRRPAADLRQLVRCRVPFRLEGSALLPVAIDSSGCP